MKSICDSQLVIWIIDDDLVSLFTTRYAIEQWHQSCNVIDFDNAETALKIFSNNLDAGEEVPDVILLDLIMPKMDGWEFLSKFDALSHRSTHTNVYILSDFTNLKDRKKAKGHPSVKGHFDKPILKSNLNTVLQKSLFVSRSI